MTEVVSRFDLKLEQREGYAFDVAFDKPFAPLQTDEPPPLGKDSGPNPSRLLAVAIANCLAASLVFCLQKKGEKVAGLLATVHVEIVRGDTKRLRIGKVDVTLKAPLPPSSAALGECLEMFEDFCVVTQSVREGIDVRVNVEAVG
jgi:uncharacterized OsmC-like protein